MVIPAFEPNDNLRSILLDLQEDGYFVLVNDGGGDERSVILMQINQL